MEIIIRATPDEVCLAAARRLAFRVRRQPTAVLGLATGATPRPVYASLVAWHRDQGLRFEQITTFNLDEFVGLPPDHPASFHRYMREHLFDHVDVAAERCHLPDGNAADLASECEAYEARIRAAGGIDLQLLGLGEDGHIGFNEAASSLSSRTRLKTLTLATQARAGFAAGSLPRHVLTMGVGTVLDARECLLIAHGERKAIAVAQLVEGAVSARWPATALQLHPRTTVIIDEAAARGLALADYYRAVYRDKPAWQRVDEGVPPGESP